MVLGRSRAKTQPAFPQGISSPAAEWRVISSTPIYETTAELEGAFPGYVERGGRLEHARLVLYENAIAVEEGRTHGFFLPFDRIVATDDEVIESEDDQTVRIRYRDGVDTRLFSIRPRAPRLMLRSGGRRNSRLLTELIEAGAPGGPVDDVPIDAFLTHWGETDAFGNETMVWHGHASASILLTGDRTPCDVFITSKSLVWGKDARSPISRVPLNAIRDVTPGNGGSRANSPAAFIGIGDGEFDRIELSFTFDSYDSGDRNALERSAFIVHLRSRNVPLNHPKPPDQPWMRAPHIDQIPTPIWPSSVTALRGQYDQVRTLHTEDANDVEAPLVPRFRDPAERLRPDRGVMTAHDWTSSGESVSVWPAAVSPIARTLDGRAIEEPRNTEDAVQSAPAPRQEEVLSMDATVNAGLPIDDPVRAYESDALSSFNDVLDVVRRREAGDKLAQSHRRPPSGAALSAALEEIVDRMGRQELSNAEASNKKARLTGPRRCCPSPGCALATALQWRYYNSRIARANE